MDMKSLLVAHGEKAAAVLVVALCAWEVGSTLTDPSIQPASKTNEVITSAVIEEKVRTIDQALRSGGAPQLKPVPPYLDDLRARMQTPVPAPALMPWMTAMPDRGPNDQTLLYVYELPPPTIEGRDFSGDVLLTISLPAPVRPKDRRVSDAPAVEWRTPSGVTNSARVVGVLVECRPGPTQPWVPIKAPGVAAGVVALGAAAPAAAATGDAAAAAPAGGGAASVRLQGLESWTRYEFRASLVALATAAQPGKGLAKGGFGVLVTAGRVAPETTAIEALPWDQWLRGFERSDPAVVQRFLAGRRAPLPQGMVAGAGEQVFVGAPTPVPALVPVTSDVRFALDRISTLGGKPVAQVLITKQFLVHGAQVWMKEPVQFKPAQGERLGGPTVIPDPRAVDGRRMNADFSTPFEVAEIRTGVPRIYYHEVRDVARSDGKRGRELQVVARSIATDVVSLRNVRTGSVFELVRLAKIPAPRPGTLVSPNLTGEVDERALFLADPAGFATPVLEPAAPRRWEPDQGPLAKLRADNPDFRDFYATDTAYVELADGRVVWYDALNRRVHVYPEPQAAGAPDAGAAPAAGVPAPAGPSADATPVPRPAR